MNDYNVIKYDHFVITFFILNIYLIYIDLN